MSVSIFVFSIFIFSALTPFFYKILKEKMSWALALAPFSAFVYLLHKRITLGPEEIHRFQFDWIPSLGINFSFYLDGFSMLMGMLVYGIGAFILIYAGGYLHGYKAYQRFFVIILIFMGAMGGLVLSSNLMTLFVFWELTSISSYLLIGFNHEQAESRWKALQALLITGMGGLSLLAGLIFLYQITGTFEFTEIVHMKEKILASDLYLPMLFCIFGGCLTKSAQFPFHFWLPNAMAAPTPVSAYLHSATMVKAGIFLLARLSPAISGSNAWFYTLTTLGAITLLTGAFMGIWQTDIKRILAYSTLAVLGTLVFMLGLAGRPAASAEWVTVASEAMILFLLAHALYKACLFMNAGAIDHETGTRDVRILSGLRKVMPFTFAAAFIAALSKAGLPFLFGFIGKETFYAATTESGLSYILPAVAVIANMGIFSMALQTGWHPFRGELSTETPKKPHEAPLSMWIGPVILSTLTLVFGCFPGLISSQLVAPAVQAIASAPKAVDLHIFHEGMWSHAPIYLSIVTVIGGFAFFFIKDKLWAKAEFMERFFKRGPEKAYEVIFHSVLKFSSFQTKTLQNGHMRYYIMIMILCTLSIVIYVRFAADTYKPTIDFSKVHWYEFLLLVLMATSCIKAITTRSRLSSAIALGVIGYGISYLFVLNSAPDLAITQTLVETLTVILYFLVIFHLPRFKTFSSRPVIIRDAIISILFGATMTLLVLKAQSGYFKYADISDKLSEWSKTQAHGNNIVNVILVDFRGVDTMGEIVVITIAAIGVISLIKLRMSPNKK